MGEKLSGVKRGRPKNVTRRLQIARCAAALFAGKGFESTTMTEIAQGAGISESLLYHYFAHKNDILETLAQWDVSLLQKLHADAARDARAAQNCESLLRTVGRRYVQFVLETNDLYVLRLMRLAPFRQVADRAREVMLEMYDYIGKRLGQMPDFVNVHVDSVTAFRLFLASVFSLVIFRERFNLRLPREEPYDALIEYAVRVSVGSCTNER